MKARGLALGVVSLAMLFGSHQAASGQSRDSACATVSISIVTGTATIPPGTTIGIAGGINNCSSKKARYTLVVSGMSSCGQRSDIASSRLTFNPGENKIWSVSYSMPTNVCAGPWDATVQVRDSNDKNGGLAAESTTSLASASTTVMVE